MEDQKITEDHPWIESAIENKDLLSVEVRLDALLERYLDGRDEKNFHCNKKHMRRDAIFLCEMVQFVRYRLTGALHVLKILSSAAGDPSAVKYKNQISVQFDSVWVAETTHLLEEDESAFSYLNYIMFLKGKRKGAEKKHEELQKTGDRLSATVREHEDEIHTLRDQISDLKAENDELGGQNHALREANAQLTNDAFELNGKLSGIQPDPPPRHANRSIDPDNYWMTVNLDTLALETRFQKLADIYLPAPGDDKTAEVTNGSVYHDLRFALEYAQIVRSRLTGFVDAITPFGKIDTTKLSGPTKTELDEQGICNDEFDRAQKVIHGDANRLCAYAELLNARLDAKHKTDLIKEYEEANRQMAGKMASMQNQLKVTDPLNDDTLNIGNGEF